jgi:branched-chain amino acid aminotransferase
VTEPLAYLNGQFIPASEARLPVFDAGVVLGAAVSEMTRTFHHRLFRLGDHLDRLLSSANSTGIDSGLSRDKLMALSRQLVEQNAQGLEANDDLGLVHFFTAGEVRTYARMTSRPLKATPTVCLHTFPLPFDLYAKKIQTGIHLITTSVRQVPAECIDPGIKCRSRMHYYLAENEARTVDPEASALLLDPEGSITETNTANFFIVANGSLLTPPDYNVLPGISRRMVLELASKIGIPFKERSISVDTAMNAEEAFITSTPFCLMAVTKINMKSLGNGEPGPIFRRIIQAWSQEVDLDIENQILERGSGARGTSTS